MALRSYSADMEIVKILSAAVALDTADIIIKANCHPMFLIRGNAVPATDFPAYTPEEAEKILMALLTPDEQEHFRKTRDFDISFGIDGLARFRVNLFWERSGLIGSVMRIIKPDIRTIEELALPPVLKRLVLEKQGLVLVTGPTGSGKTTTLAAMLDYANVVKSGHIVTIEDPIEVLYDNKKSVISQREIGPDTGSFSMGLRAALRQAPSIILIGEMRDRETIEAAMKAAETGHLVLSTLHTIDAVQTINRIINAFPPHEQVPVRIGLGNVLKGCIAQRLVPRADRPGRVAIQDILVVTANAREAILKGSIDQLYEIIKNGTFDGMQATNDALLGYYRNGIISADAALTYSPIPNEMLQLLRASAREVSSVV